MMASTPPAGSLSTLRRFARSVPTSTSEQCEFCAAPLPDQHRHLFEVAGRQVSCVCRACALLFSNEAASAGKHRLIPERRQFLPDFELSDDQWEQLRIPVGMAFFFQSTPAERVVALYPSPAGPVESLLTLTAWEELTERNPVLGTLQPDVEALLVNHVRDSREHYLVPIDECYRLVGLIRTSWRGLSGGREVWGDIEEYFANLRRRARVVSGAQHSVRR